VDPIGSGVLRLTHLLTQACEVSGEN